MTNEALLRRFLEAQDKLVTQASDFSLATIASMVDSNSIDPSPEYQRRERWSPAKQSALIESFLLNVPVPPVYLAEEQFGVYSVIDGKQRITAIHDFMNGRLPLKSLAKIPELEGHRIADLPEAMSNALRVRPYIRAVTLLKQSDPLLKYEVFVRLNRGGEALTPQEVRNVAFRGVLNESLFAMAAHPFLRAQFNISDTSERFRQMNDIEFVLRFLALESVFPDFRGDLAGTMDSFMRENAREESVARRSAGLFTDAIGACESIWGDRAFRRYENNVWRGRALLGMYDAQMLAVSLVGSDVVKRAVKESERVVRRTETLFSDSSFVDSVTVATNTPTRLEHRVNAMIDVLEGL